MRQRASRLYRNFYPSAIDSLHVWAMLVETGCFACCALDVMKDAVDKTDLTVWTLDRQCVKICLYVDSPNCKWWTRYKRSIRGKAAGAIDLILKMERPKGVGNKRWYTLEDLLPVFEAAGLKAV